jgi:hypothetical protein
MLDTVDELITLAHDGAMLNVSIFEHWSVGPTRLP